MTISIEQAVAQALAAHERGDLETARRGYEDILALDDRCSDAWHLLGVLHHQTGQSAIAVEQIQKALALLEQSPDDESRPGKFSRYYNNLGLSYLDLGEKVEAERCFRIALKYNRGHSSFWYNLANLIHQSGFHEEAAEAWQEVIRLEGDCAESGIYWNNLGNCFLSQGENDQALACFEKAVSFTPRESNFYSNWLMTSLYDPKFDVATLKQRHEEWDRRYGSPDHVTTHLQNEPSRKIRVGYVSADFKVHAINSFFEGFFSAHDREKFEFYLYAEVREEDEISRRLASQATTWCNTTSLDDSAMAARIRADRIDILVDLAGHTAGNSLRVFAMKPAPIQLSYLGYPNATGLKSIPFRIVDSVIAPDDEQRDTGLIRIDPCFCCYKPNDETPNVAAPPCVQNGFVTFGSLHGLFRLNDSVIDLWCEVLRAVPQSRIFFFRTTLRGKAREKLRSRLLERGISADRFDLEHELEVGRSHFDLYRRVDILLDTFPWSGHTTCCESLWMGVPVVTLDVGRQSSRMVASVLTTLGRTDWIAHTSGEYVRIAAELANDREQLVRHRAELRPLIRNSSICDYHGFAAKLEAAFSSLWADYHENCMGVSNP